MVLDTDKLLGNLGKEAREGDWRGYVTERKEFVFEVHQIYEMMSVLAVWIWSKLHANIYTIDGTAYVDRSIHAIRRVELVVI